MQAVGEVGRISDVTLLASIPSPSSGVIDIGPLHIHMYGLMLLLAIAACIGITGLRWTRLGGDWDLVLRVAVWGVAFGIVGARAYHDITSWNEVPDKWWGPFAVWQGGLGVWGGIALGALAGAWVIRRSGESVRLFADAIAPGLLVAQGIGRWGNWFNQELYGKPTNLPWGLKIDETAPAAAVRLLSDTFQPTFLYEFVYDLVMAGVLILVGRRFRIKPPALFALYVSFYTFGRTFEELAPRRPVAPPLGRAAELLGLDRRVRDLDRLLHLVAVLPSRREPAGRAPQAARDPEGADDGRPAGPRPPAPLASPRCWSATSSSTSTRSRARSTCCSRSSCGRSSSPGTSTSPTSSSRSSSGSPSVKELDLDACGEFLVLVGALLELKARELFPEEQVDLADLDPEEAAEELARRLEEFRRIKEAAGWLLERLAAENDRYFRVGPAPLQPRPEPRVAPQQPEALAASLRALAAEPPDVSLAHMGLRFPPVSQFLERFRALLRRRRRFDFDREAEGLSRIEQAVAFLALLELRKAGEISLEQAAPFAPIRVARAQAGKAHSDEEGERSWNARSA